MSDARTGRSWRRGFSILGFCALAACGAEGNGVNTAGAERERIREGGSQERSVAEEEPLALALRSAAVDDGRAPLTLAQSRALLAVIEALERGDADGANQRFTALFESIVTAGGARDPNGLVLLVLREAYLATSEDLRFFAEKVRYYEEQRQLLRAQIGRLDELARTTEAAATRTAIAALRADLAARLDELGEDAQLANVDVQNVLQKQQQTLQMMSNVSKMLYDTAQSVIRKLGG